MKDIREYHMEYELGRLCHEEKMAQSSFEFWTKAEAQVRIEYPLAYEMIANFKDRRKSAKADLDYWKPQADAAFEKLEMVKVFK